MKRLLSYIFSVEILFFLLPAVALAAPLPDSLRHPARGPVAPHLRPAATRPAPLSPAVALVKPLGPQGQQRFQRLQAPNFANTAAPTATELAPARAAHYTAAQRQLALDFERQRQALRQTQARLRTAEQSRYQAWLAAAGLAAGLLLTLGLGWWASRQLRRRAQREAQLRTRIAADLHTEVGTLLARVSQQAHLLRQQQPSPDLDRLLGSSHAAAHTVRDMVWSIDAQADTVGALLDRMREHLAQTATPAGLLTELHADGLHNARRLPPELRQYFYLIFKEAVANVLRHASRPTKVVVTLTHYAVANVLMLAVEDDGQPGSTAAHGGTGLRTMQERALALRGRLEVGRQPRGGFRVWLQVPF